MSRLADELEQIAAEIERAGVAFKGGELQAVQDRMVGVVFRLRDAVQTARHLEREAERARELGRR